MATHLPITGSPTHPIHSPKVDLVLFPQNPFVLACQVGHIEVLLGRSWSEPPFRLPGEAPLTQVREAQEGPGWVGKVLRHSSAAGQSAQKGWESSQFPWNLSCPS